MSAKPVKPVPCSCGEKAAVKGNGSWFAVECSRPCCWLGRGAVTAMIAIISWNAVMRGTNKKGRKA